MPLTVCPDSEGEDDEIIYDERISQQSSHSWVAKEAAAFLAEDEPGADDNRPAGTTSSEMAQQVYDAHRGLFAPSDKAETEAPAMPSSITPGLPTSQRRRQTVTGSDSGASPTKKVRRTKTTNMKTYGSKPSRTLQGMDHSDFEVFKEGRGMASKSLPVKPGSPGSGLPAGTIQQDFVEHDPMMFRDTGSTNAFNDSSQLQMIEQARANIISHDADAGHPDAAPSEKHESSSFPWTISADPTQSPKSSKSKGRQADAACPDEGASLLSRSVDKECRDNQHPHESLQPQTGDFSHRTDVEPDAQEIRKPDDIIQVRKPPQSSPIVHIPRHEASALDDVEKPARVRKRKSSERDEDPLKSDDRHIDLPKEQYKPRPSRRRATQVPEEVIDYGLTVERAVKKRRKSANATLGTSQPTEAAEPTPDRPQEEAAQHAHAVATKDTSVDVLHPAPVVAKSKPVPHVEPLETTQTPEKHLAAKAKLSAHDNVEPPPSSEKKDVTNSKSMLPPPVPISSSRKGRRSKTTIFEDHITLGASQRSPSLRQQQALRKSALEELPKDSSQGNRRKRRSVFDEEDDDEDELSKPDHVEEPVLPKKRGRPAKTTTAAKPKSTERVVEDSEDEDDDLEEEAEEVIAPPKKKGRGRGRNPKADEQVQETEPAPVAADQPKPSEKANISSSDSIAVAQSGPSSPSKAALERKDANRQLDAYPAGNTAKPAAPPVKETPSPQTAVAKPSPTSHSPLKSSSLVPLRVGLSKRRRIPPLLKTFRPQPKPSTR